MKDHWILHEEKEINFWSYPVCQTRLGKLKVDDRISKGEYRTYAVQRRWYNARTREILTETEELLGFDEVLITGRAIWDHRKQKMLLPYDL